MLRFAVLAVYCASSFGSSLSGLAFAAIAKSVAAYYGVSFNAVNQISIIGMLMPFLGYPLAMWLADTQRFELPYYIAMIVLIGLRWARVYYGADPDMNGFIVILVSQGLTALVSPCLGCLAPALSAEFFPKQERGLATSLGTIASLLGFGAGMVISPLYKDDIPALLNLHAMAMSIPMLLSIFVLDFCACCLPHQPEDSDLEEEDVDAASIQRTTSFQRLVRSYSQHSTPSQQGFSPILPEEHAFWLGPPSHLHESSATPHHRNDIGHFLSPEHPITLPYVYNSGLHKLRKKATNSRMVLDREQVPFESIQEDLREVESYREALCRVLKDFTFLRLLASIGLSTGVVTTWLALVDESAPPSLDSPRGAQLFAGLFFGCGFVGAIVVGTIMDKTRAFGKIGRWSCALTLPAATLAMGGWHYDNYICTLAGVGLVGLFSFGMLPLSIEFAIELTSAASTAQAKRPVDLGGTIGGIVQCSTNLFSIAIISATTPGNIPHLSADDIPFVWLALLSLGSLSFFTLPLRASNFDSSFTTSLLAEAA